MALSHVHTHFLPQRSITDDDHVVTHSRLSKTQQTRTIPLYPTQKLSAFSLKFRSKRSPSFGVPHHRPNNFIRASAQVTEPTSAPIPTKLFTFTKVFLRFLRPYSLYETIIASVSMVTRSWLIENPNPLSWSLLFNALIGLFALFCLNVYYVGINQIFDVDIDRVNKPELPIAAGDLSIESAWILVIAFAVNGLLIVALKGGLFLTVLYSLGLFVATAYSAPPFRWKRFAIGPMFTIVTMRGILLNIGLHYATKAALGITFGWTAPLIFIMISATMFATAISFTKDLTDIEGDTKYGISTLATKLGVRNTSFLGSGIILLNYGTSILAAVLMPQVFRPWIMIPAHLILASLLIFRSWVVDRANYTKEASLRYYRFMWDLFYAEFLIYPFV